MLKRTTLTGLCLFLFILAACKSETDNITPAASLSPDSAVTVKKESWEETWNKTVDAARVQRKVVVYQSEFLSAQGTAAITDVAKKKFGLSVEWTTFPSAQLRPKINMERSAGLYIPDVLFMGSSEIAAMRDSGAFDFPLDSAIVLPEVGNPRAWFQQQFPWFDKEHSAIAFQARVNTPLAINTELVSPQDIQSYRDMLAPKWKGKILSLDPTITPAITAYTMLGSKIVGWDFIRDLAKQEMVITRDSTLAIDWLARGKYPFLIYPIKATYVRYKEAGAPIQLVIPKEGSFRGSSPGIITLLSKAPHPDAAKVFVNWILTRDAQMILSKDSSAQSAREDVPTDYLDPATIRDPAKQYINRDDPEFLKEEVKYRQQVVEIFAPYFR